MNDGITPDENNPHQNDQPENDQPEIDPWESEMSDEFERRVRDLHEAPLDLSSVKGKAMHIKRKRQAIAAGTVLAVAAAIVPIALLVANSTNSSSDGVQPAGPTPSQTVIDTPSTPPTDDPTAPTTPTTPVTAPDDTAYGFDFIEVTSGNAVLHESDGGVIELPRPDYTDAADLGGVIAAYRQGADANGFVDVITDGQVTTTYDARSSMVITPTSSAVAFITTDGELLVVSADGESSLSSDVGRDDVPAALIGTGDCSVEAGCHPFLNDANGTRAPYEINYEGPTTVVVPDAIRLNDANDDFLASIQTSYSDNGSCGGLFDRRAQKFVFKTCKSQVLEISPQGDFVIGTSSYGDGIGAPYVSILDGTTGDEVARYTPVQGYVDRMAWADDTHAVATVFTDDRWSIVSLSTDGTVETVVGPSALGSGDAPTYFLTGPG